MPTVVQERNKEIVQRWIDEVFNAGKLRAVDELKVSSYLDWTPLPSPYQRVDLPVSGIKAALPEWLAGLPDFRFTADRMIAEDDFVVCLGHWQAHHQGAYKGHAPTDRRVGGTRIDIFRVAGDKMVEHWGCGNELAFLQMIGALDAENGGRAPDDPEAVTREFIERVIRNRDVAAVAELLAPDMVDRGGLALSLLGLLHAYPDLDVSVDDVSVDGDEVTVATTVTGTAPDGSETTVERRDAYVVKDGRIAECRRLTADADVSHEPEA